MLKQILTTIKYCVLFISIFYGYEKLAKIKFKLNNLTDIPVAAIFAVVLFYATEHMRLFIPVGFLTLSCIYVRIRYRNTLLNTITLTTISLGITIFAMIISFIISIPLDYVNYKVIAQEIAMNIITAVVISLLQIIFIYSIFNVKRFKSGILIERNGGNADILLLMSILSIFLMTLFYTDNIVHSPTEIIISTILFCGLVLMVLWKKHVANSYVRQIYKRNETAYENQIREYEKEREKILNQNAELAKILHRDNKLIPAITAAVQELIATSPTNSDLIPLQSQLEELASERQQIVSLYEDKSSSVPKTGIIPLDAALFYVYCKAVKCQVDIRIEINKNSIPTLLSNVPDMTSLCTILCDLGDNAVIAAKNQPNGKIKVRLDLSSNFAVIDFYDNGTPFDEKVVAHMGRKRITTHSDEGGSGIGLMTLFEILDAYNSSYRLSERVGDEFSKCISITFDSLHCIEIISDRESIKNICRTRPEFVYKNCSSPD